MTHIDPDAARSDFASSKSRLSYLLRALFDIAPDLLPVVQGIATQRPFLSNIGIHLPENGRALRGLQAQQWYDAAAMHAGAHLRHSTHRFKHGTLKPIQIVLIGLLEDARVEGLAIADLPGLRRLWLPFHVAKPAHGDSFVVLMLRLARCLLDPSHHDPHPWVIKGRRLFQEATDGNRTMALLTPAVLRDMASRLGNDIGQMRLQFNARDHVVEPAYRDDNAYLWDFDEPTQAQPVFHSETDAVPRQPRMLDVAEAGPPVDALLAKLQYAEWDRLINDYRSAWCTVIESRPSPGDPTVLQAALKQHVGLLVGLEQMLRQGNNRERVRLRAQLRGDELDLDAAVRSAIDRRALHTPEPKVYQRMEQREHQVAVLLLLDASASTADPVPKAFVMKDAQGSSDGWVQGGTVLDFARHAALLSAQAFSRAGNHCAIHAFSSNGRHEVLYQRTLDFGDAFDNHKLASLAGVGSRLSTRMGAALRHASALLSAQPQFSRLLVLITDGEPHDIDIFDRRYLVEDARRAVIEAKRHGVKVFCISLDTSGDDYMRAIFGVGNYRVLDRMNSLLQILPVML